ncbi:MAG: branched-chain amino acid ABC transporter permease [Oscillospiraceae bacterium]|jgi:branched-chain amino acid transport system permease protein|nr:branched-chain amino acid ABC transporter permease [Oscillospiraceae bacterium]
MKKLLARLPHGKGEWFFGSSGRATFFGSAAALLLVCFVDALSPSATIIPPYYKHILFSCLLYSILSLSLNLVTGFVGQLSLGHAAFFGIGAYVTGALTKFYGINFWLTIPAAAVLAALVAVPLAAAAQRVKGAFLVVITYGFGEVLRYVAINTDFLGGSAGMPGIKPPTIFGFAFNRVGPSGKELYILLAFALVSLLSFFTWRIEKSRVGYALSAIREDEIAAVAMGVNTKYYKTLAIVLSAFLCGVAGSLQAGYASFVSPEMLSSTQSILILTMVIVGGPRSIKGSILGAALLTILPEFFHSVKDWLGLGFDPWMILYGLILIILMRFRPQGFWGKTTVF